jgi:transposase-like protein
MPLETERECPRCGTEQTFWRVAATTLHLGQKTKWRCEDCGFGFVRVNGISTADAAEGA